MRGALWAMAASVGLVLMAGGAKKVTNSTLPLGIRLNNPGNIEQDAANPIHWEGMALAQTHLPYIEYITPEYGIRALADNLKNYELRDGIHTLAEAITRFAPPSSNPTAAYIADVSKWTGINPTAHISLIANMHAIVPAIIHQENGMMPYTSAQLAKGIAMAGIPA